jgi:hypothetical protein
MSNYGPHDGSGMAKKLYWKWKSGGSFDPQYVFDLEDHRRAFNGHAAVQAMDEYKWQQAIEQEQDAVERYRIKVERLANIEQPAVDTFYGYQRFQRKGWLLDLRTLHNHASMVNEEEQA